MTTDQGAEPEPVAPPDQLAPLQISGRVELPAESAFVAFGDGAVWATSTDGTLWRIDPNSLMVTHTIDVPGLGLARAAFGEGSIWVAAMESGRLYRLDPANGEIQAEIALGETADRPMAMAFDGGRVWVANQTQNTLTIVDAMTNSVVDEIDMSEDAPGSPDRAPSSVTIEKGVAWVVEHRADALARVDSTSTVTRTCIGSPDPGNIVAAGGALWVTDSGGVVSILDPASGQASARLGLPGATAGDLVADDGMVWVGAGSAVVGIDSQTRAVVAVAALGDLADTREFAGGVSVAASPDSIWTTDPSGNGLVRIPKAAID